MNELLKQLDDVFSDLFLDKAPSLPQNIKDLIVNFLPWGAVIMTLLSLPFIVAAFGLGAITLPFAVAFGTGLGVLGFIRGGLGVGIFLLGALSIKPLFDKKEKGWRLSFYGLLLSMVIAILSFQISGLIFEAVSLYFLYQVKEVYTGSKPETAPGDIN